MKSTVATLIAMMMASTSVQAETLLDRVDHHRAIETIIWGMPMLNFKAMRDGFARDAGVGNGDVAYSSVLQTWELQTTTNNNTTPYVFAFWDLSDGPMVFEVPKVTSEVGLVGTLMDVYQRTMVEVGNAGYESGLGAKYLLLPPGYDGAMPRGYTMIRSPSNNGYTLLRPIIKSTGPEDMAKAAEFVKGIKVYPLSQADNPQTRHIDIAGKAIAGVPRFDAGMFERLDDIIEEEPIEKKDLSFLGMAQRVGVEKGVPFAPDERMQSIHEAAAKEAEQFLKDEYLDRSTPLYYPNRQWSTAIPENAIPTYMDWDFPNYLDYTGRGAGYYAYYTSFRRVGAASFYLKTSRDADGVRLDGGESYKLTVPADVPARNFWSVIAYTIDDATWFDNQPKAGVASIDVGVETNADGTVDVHLGPKAPADKEANWVPANPSNEYFLYFRTYGPTAPMFDKSWKINDVVKVN